MCFRILRWNEYAGLASGPDVIIRLLIKGEARGPKLEILEKALLPALKVRERAMSQVTHVALEAGKCKETFTTGEAPNHLTLS